MKPSKAAKAEFAQARIDENKLFNRMFLSGLAKDNEADFATLVQDGQRLIEVTANQVTMMSADDDGPIVIAESRAELEDLIRGLQAAHLRCKR